MTTSVQAVDAAPAPAPMPDEISLEDAGDIIRSWDNPEAHQSFEGEPPIEEAPPKRELAEKPMSDPPQEDPAELKTHEPEQPEAPEEDSLPAIEAPRSWTKEAKEAFAKLPRDLQEETARIATAREAEFRRSQNELAEIRKAVQAEREAAEKARSEYDSKLPSLVKTIEETLQAEFGDIKDISDVRKLQAEDPFRFQQWQLKQMELSAAQQAKQEADRRSEYEAQTKWASHINDESQKFADTLNDADKAKLSDRMKDAPKFLEAKGFSNSELQELAKGKLISLYDHRIQSLIHDGMKYRDVMNAPKAVASTPKPTVQKPGTARVASADADIQVLSRKLDQTGSEADGWELLQAMMKRSSR